MVALFLLAGTLLLLAGCGQSGRKGTAGADAWSGYSADRQGWIALTDNAYLFYTPEWGDVYKRQFLVNVKKFLFPGISVKASNV